MQPHEVLDIVLRTADQIASEYTDHWEGDIYDFVSASVCVSEELTSGAVADLHKEMCGSSFMTADSEIFFVGSRRNRTIYVKPMEDK
jgi:hypothetical protein